MVPGRKTVVATGEAGRAAAAGLVQRKDSAKPLPNLISIDTGKKGVKIQVGRTIERKSLVKRKKA